MSLARFEKILLFLTILFLPTQLGKHFWPQFSFVYSLPIDYLSPTLYFWDLLVVVLCLIFLISRKPINRMALNLFFFFILTQILSFLSTFSNIGVGLVRLEQYLIAGLFGAYIASRRFSEIRSIVFTALVIVIPGESILAMIQFIKEGTVGLWILGERTFTLSTPGIATFDYKGIQLLRPYATFPHPNTLAGFLVVTILLLLLWDKRQNLTRLAIFFGGLAIFLTVSRVVITAGLGSALILAKRNGRILLCAITIILLPVLYTRFSSIFSFDNFALTRREGLSWVALNLWVKSPILGIGLNNFIPSGADSLLVGPSRFLQPVHNIFLLALSETGLIGLVGLVSLMGYPIMLSLRKQGSIKNGSRYKIGMTIIWIIVIFLGLFDHYFLTLPQGYRLLFLVWGLSFSMLE